MAEETSEISAENTDPAPRFQLFDDEGLSDFIDSTDSANTKKQIKYSLSVFEAYCTATNVGSYDDLDNTALDLLLSKFYAGARNKKGEMYSKKTVQAIRFGLQRHFLAQRGVDIIKGNDFPVSKKTFKALLARLKQEGKASVQRHETITKEDMDLIQQSLDICTPKGLQQKVFIDIMIYFANRGMENLRMMKPTDFVFHEDDDRSYFTMRDMATKNHATDDEASQGGRMYATDGTRCPVANMLKLKNKLNPRCEFLWQRPKKCVTEDDECWFDNSPVGRDTLSKMMKTITTAAGCSKVYTNHCLRATTCTLLDHSGCTNRDIMSVSGHRSETSIKYYVRTSEEKKEEMSDIISSMVNPHAVPGPSSTSGDIEQEPCTSVVAQSSEAEEVPLTLSQVEKIFKDISNSPNSVCNVSNQMAVQNPSFNISGCVVHIHNNSR